MGNEKSKTLNIRIYKPYVFESYRVFPEAKTGP